jgi:hypothetical protein
MAGKVDDVSMEVDAPMPIGSLDVSMSDEAYKETMLTPLTPFNILPPLTNNAPAELVEENVMFCRPCYEQYYQKLRSISFSKIHQCIVTGSPGIGKSFFYLYVAQRLLEDEELNVKRVLMTNLSIHPEGLLVWQRQENGEIFKSDINFLLDTIKECQMDKNTWLLMDGPNKNDGYWKLPTLKLGFNVWFLSPNMGLINSLEKSWTKRLYMPLWSRDEIILANRIYQVPPDELMTRYNFFGGVARWVFDTEQEARRNSVQEAAYSSSFFKDIDNIGANNIFLDTQSHHLFVIEALSMESFEVQFASSEIEDITIAAAEKKTSRNLVEFIHAATGIKVLSNIRGRLFERYAHRILTLPGQKFKCKVFGNKEESEFELGNVQVCQYRIIKDDDGKSLIQFDSEGDAEMMYSIPISRTQGAFDSFLRNMFFQITVNTGHDIKIGFIEKCLELRGKMDQNSKPEVPIYDCIELWFVVPDDLFDNFSTKRPFKVAGRTVKVGDGNAPVWLNKLQQGVISIPISSKICDTLQKLQKIHD